MRTAHPIPAQAGPLGQPAHEVDHAFIGVGFDGGPGFVEGLVAETGIALLAGETHVGQRARRLLHPGSAGPGPGPFHGASP